MKKSLSKKIAVIMLSGLMTTCVAADGILRTYNPVSSLAESSTTEQTQNSNAVTIKEVEDLDSTPLFLENYNTDIVKTNSLDLNKSYVAIVTLEGMTLSDYASESGLTLQEYAKTFSSTTAIKKLESDLNIFRNRLQSSGVEYEELYSYNTLAKGVAIRAEASVLDKIAEMYGVEHVIVSEHYARPEVIEIANDTNVYQTGIYNTSAIDPELRGNGMVIAVVDTGIDIQHPAFQDENFAATEFALTQEDIARLLPIMQASKLSAETSTETAYINSKQPFVFDYADKDTNPYPSYSAHGVHVAGIIGGNHTWIDQATIDSDDDLKFDYDEQAKSYYFEGVVPDAQIVTLKVFTDDITDEALGGADTEDILAALEDATILGVDVINMSLGSSAGFSRYADDFMAQVYTNIEEAGISLVCAASNDFSSGYGGVNGTNLTSNPDSATVGSPSTYPAAISVASIEGQRAPYMLANDETMVFFTEASDGNSNKLDFIEGMFDVLKDKGYMEKDATSAEVQYVVIPGLGRSYNYTSAIRQKLQEKPSIALVSRGTTTFEEKMKIAKENGALGIIIYNNVAGTINMTMGAKNKADIIPSCSILMDIGNELVLNAKSSVGTMVLDKSKTAGPFMSTFSSWGPTPSLELKPEITAYGGNVTSAVAGGYDVYSGTSMASPNMAGAVAIVRKYLKKQYPDMSAKEIADRAYQLMMSTSKLVINEYGNPYSPRKQGSGIADIEASLATQSYITVKDSEGNTRNKTKIELGDDPSRKGVYEFTFYVNNTSSEYAMYDVKPYVMTETVSSDGKTVAEKAYMFTDSQITVTVDGVVGNEVFVAAGNTAEVKIKIALTAAQKAYLDANFVNGMYVEGFIELIQTFGADSSNYCDLSIPYLAFYGDWTDAPMLDYSSFEIAENLKDDSIPDDEKFEIQFFETTPYSKYGDKYILPMGQYIYVLPDDAEPIYAEEDKAAVSRYQFSDHYSSYEFYAVYAGLLRGMVVCDVQIVNEYTGEVVWQDHLTNVAKGYAAGGSTRPGFVKVEFNPAELNLPNNSKYRFSMEGYLDYGDGKKGHNNSYSFSFYTDYEAPTLVGANLRYEDYIDANEEEQTRIYLDLTTYDNHYTQGMMVCYISDDNYLRLLNDYVVPVYSDRVGQTVTTTFEITDYYEEFFDNIYVQVEDYAMNYKVYTLDLNSAITFPERITFDQSEVTLSVNQAIKPTFKVEPANAQDYDLVWDSLNKDVARVENGEIFAVAPGVTYVTVQASRAATPTAPSARIKVTVLDREAQASGYKKLSFGLIADKGGSIVDPTGRTVEVHPNKDIQFVTKTEPWYLPAINVRWSSSDQNVATVDENGLVHTLKEGMAVITARQVLDNGDLGLFSASAFLSVGPEFVISNYYLREYHGVGGDVVVPDELNFMYIDEECFMDNDTITSFVVPEDVMQIFERAFYGCTKLKKITLPKSLTLIGDSAFENCTALETIDMTDSLSTIFGNRCFYGCTSLNKIINDKRLTAIWDYTFAGCTSLTSLDISNLVQVGKFSFAGCSNLSDLTISRYTVIGEGMFFGCSALKELVIPAQEIGKNAFYACDGLTSVEISGKTKVGEGAFRSCVQLSSVYFTGEVYRIDSRAFEGCIKLKSLFLPNCTTSIAQDAFYRCTEITLLGIQQNTLIDGGDAFRACEKWTNIYRIKVEKVNGEIKATQLADGTTANYKVYKNLLYSVDGSELVLVPFGAKNVTISSQIKRIGNGAFYGIHTLEEIDLPEGLEEIGDYAFSYTSLKSVKIPASITSLGVGAFSYCYDLGKVEFATGSKLTEIPEGCFNTVFGLTELALPATVTYIGEYAFGATGLETLYVIGKTPVAGTFSLDGMSIKTIEEGAFSSTHFQTVILPKSLEYLGTGAFGMSAQLTDVTFTGATNMSDYVFFDCHSLERVKFAEGMKHIGNYTFASTAGNKSLKEVILPSTLEEIGDYAFYACLAIETIEVPASVLYIGESAFEGDVALTNINFQGVKEIGAYAFAETGNLGEVNLPSVKHIGTYAFYMSGATQFNIPAVEIVDDGGLAYNNILYITLPSSLKKMGNGALHYNFYLEGITLQGGDNGEFFIDQIEGEAENTGVLYQRLPNGGYQAVAYPGGNSLTEYSVLEGTVRIGEMAFTGATILERVELPVSLTTIGDKGFYDCRAYEYVFNGLKAPNLEAYYIDGDAYEASTNGLIYLKEIFSRNGAYSDERFYANFYFYAMVAYYNEGLDFGLRLYYPDNGIGYDEFMWNVFFTRSYTLGKEAPNETTMDAIQSVQTVMALREEINSLIGAADQQAAKVRAIAITALVKEARVNVNSVMGEQQLDYLNGGYDGTNYAAELLTIEQAMRAVKDHFGIITEVVSIRLQKMPNKTVYKEGETIDTTGMELYVEYDDGTNAVITSGFTVTPESASTSSTRITVSFGGKTTTFRITVNADGEQPGPGTDPGTDPGTEPPASGCAGGCAGGCGSMSIENGLISGGTMMLGLMLVFAVSALLRRKKR